jgi:hypothetical protein
MADSASHEVISHVGHVCRVKATVDRDGRKAVEEYVYDASDASDLGQRVLAMESSGHPMAPLWRNRLDRLRADLPRRARQRAEYAAVAKLEGR